MLLLIGISCGALIPSHLLVTNIPWVCSSSSSLPWAGKVSPRLNYSSSSIPLMVPGRSTSESTGDWKRQFVDVVMKTLNLWNIQSLVFVADVWIVTDLNPELLALPVQGSDWVWLASFSDGGPGAWQAQGSVPLECDLSPGLSIPGTDAWPSLPGSWPSSHSTFGLILKI